MAQELVLLLVGFLRTTGLGGLLGHYFQNRAWDHQQQASLFATERQTATAVFQELSTLMDKRLYRMLQLRWKLADEATPAALLEQHLDRYRDILYERNDNLNRNLALVERYFGIEVRR